MWKFDKFLEKSQKNPWGAIVWLTDKEEILSVNRYKHTGSARDFIRDKPSYKSLSEWFECHWDTLVAELEKAQNCVKKRVVDGTYMKWRGTI
jgi:hypothetical protein